MRCVPCLPPAFQPYPLPIGQAEGGGGVRVNLHGGWGIPPSRPRSTLRGLASKAIALEAKAALVLFTKIPIIFYKTPVRSYKRETCFLEFHRFRSYTFARFQNPFENESKEER